MATIVVAGALANKPGNGGEAWVRLSWALGLRRLGFEVHLLEEIDRSTCVDRAGRPVAVRASWNLAYFTEVVGRFVLDGAALVTADGEEVHGAEEDDLLDLAESAELLVNISGNLRRPDLFGRFRRKAYVDIDPGFTQFWHSGGLAGARLAGHDLYFTIAENVGSADCSIPMDGVQWRTTRQPVVLDEWPVVPSSPGRFTTIASWRGPLGRVEYDGRTFGLKLDEWRKVAELPALSAQRFEAALAIDPAETRDIELLSRHGWRLVDPGSVAGDPVSFRAYVQSSSAEFSVAQGIYVETRSGWFSDRTVRYLASGKPALVQDTGFSRTLPVGDGLVPFRTLDEAVAGAARIAGDYHAHCRTARELAEAEFDSDRVLARFLEDAGVSS